MPRLPALQGQAPGVEIPEAPDSANNTCGESVVFFKDLPQGKAISLDYRNLLETVTGRVNPRIKAFRLQFSLEEVVACAVLALASVGMYAAYDVLRTASPHQPFEPSRLVELVLVYSLLAFAALLYIEFFLLHQMSIVVDEESVHCQWIGGKLTAADVVDALQLIFMNRGVPWFNEDAEHQSQEFGLETLTLHSQVKLGRYQLLVIRLEEPFEYGQWLLALAPLLSDGSYKHETLERLTQLPGSAATGR